MHWRICCLPVIAGIQLCAATTLAQFGNPGIGNPGGVQIDPQGVVRTLQLRKEAPAAVRKRQQEFLKEKLPPEIIVHTERRVISLRELDQRVRQQLEAEGELDESLLALCGLNRIDEILIDLPSRDILLVGPAGGYAPDGAGRRRNVQNGSPPLLLDDLVIGLRAAWQSDPQIGCSIDPLPENMARFQNYLAQNAVATSVAAAAQRYQRMAELLGYQEISVWGVLESSHAALVLVEADLRMKRISIGNDPSGVKGIPSQLALLKPQGNSLQRWWFVPDYAPIQTDADRTWFSLSGPRLKLLAQEEYTNAAGQRFDAAATRPSVEEFARRFTEHYSELAEQQPVFAELRNLFDAAVVGAVLRRERLCERSGCDLPTLMKDERLPRQSCPVAKTVHSTSQTRMVGNVMLGLVGGVSLDPRPVLRFEPRATELAPTRPLPPGDGLFQDHGK